VVSGSKLVLFIVIRKHLKRYQKAEIFTPQ
jgi:hypothetical protein